MFRYIGNKSAIVSDLLNIITQDVEENSVFYDPMCGTASVCEILAQRGFKVIASDSLTFPSMHAEVRIRLNQEPKFSKLGMRYSEVITFLNNSKAISDYFANEFSDEGNPKNASKPRMYFTGQNAMKIDGVLKILNSWYSEKIINNSENKLLRHDLIMAANKVANIAGTYGHYRSTFSKSSQVELRLKPSSFNEFASKENKVFVGNAEDLVPRMTMDYLYLDPPYKKRQYAANYHLLETIARGDKPEAIGESGLRDWWPQYSDFCSKRKIAGAFEQILKSGNFRGAFVSYSEDGLLTDKEMSRILSQFGKVKRRSIMHKRFKSNKSNLGDTVKEYVYEIRP